MTEMMTPEDPLAKVIEKSIEKHTHMARRLYPDVYATLVAADVREWLAAEVTEKQEWEYGYVAKHSGIVVPLTHPDDPLYAKDRKVRRRKAGPWEPVEAAREAGR